MENKVSYNLANCEHKHIDICHDLFWSRDKILIWNYTWKNRDLWAIYELIRFWFHRQSGPKHKTLCTCTFFHFKQLCSISSCNCLDDKATRWYCESTCNHRFYNFFLDTNPYYIDTLNRIFISHFLSDNIYT